MMPTISSGQRDNEVTPFTCFQNAGQVGFTCTFWVEESHNIVATTEKKIVHKSRKEGSQQAFSRGLGKRFNYGKMLPDLIHFELGSEAYW